MKQIAIVITVLFAVAGCEYLGDLAALQAADFYECPPGRTLVVCAPGTGPPNAECTDVGSGQTTIAPRNCT